MTKKYKTDGKFILDPCCGPKHMWVNKNHPNVIYGDIRREKKGFNWHRPNSEINPDMIMDFRDIPFPNESFKLVVFDPPHYIGKDRGRNEVGADDLSFHPRKSGIQVTQLKYGLFNPLTWRRDLKSGFDECWRVLENYGVLIFKWTTVSESYREVLKVVGKTPLFHYTRGGKKYETYWACFMKLPEKYNPQTRLEGLTE